jgi:hypothetical protein
MTQLLTQDIPPEMRRSVLTAVTSSPLLVGIWAEESGCDDTDDNGCPQVVAAFAAINQPVNAKLVNALLAIGGSEAVERQISRMLGGIPTDMLRRAWLEWDRATVQERSECVQEFRRALVQLDEDECDAPDVPIRKDFRITEKIRAAALVGACVALMFIGAVL